MRMVTPFIRPGRRRRGFSALEFMTALVVGSILTVIAVSAYQIYEREMPVRHAARRLSHAFSAARAFAVSNDSTYAVRISEPYNNFWIDETDELGYPIQPKVTSPEPFGDQVAIDGIMFGENLTTDALAVPVLFYPYGNSDDVRVFLHLKGTDPGNERNIYTVRLYGPTGQSTVFDGQRLMPDPTP